MILSRSTALLFVIALAISAFAAAASPTHLRFAGRVTDPAGAPVRGAHISVIGIEGSQGPVVSATSDADGRFAVEIEPGAYVVQVEMKNFGIFSDRVEVTAGDSSIRQITLQVAGVRDSITVRAPQGYTVPSIGSATKTDTPLRDLPQSVTVITHKLIQDQLMTGMGDVIRYVPGVMLHQGENNRDQVIIRGNNSSADFFLDGVRDDVQYYRDLYNLERVEALRGPNALVFGRGGAGGVINRVTKEAGFTRLREIDMQGGAFGNKRIAADLNEPLSDTVAVRLNTIYENSGSFRNDVSLTRTGIAPSLTFMPTDATRITFGYENFHDGRTADRGISSFAGCWAFQFASVRMSFSLTRFPSQLRSTDSSTMRMLTGRREIGPTPLSSSAGRE